MLLIAGSFLAFILLIAIVIYMLRLFSITMFHIPGFDLFFQYVIIIIPYVIFLVAYYYLNKKLSLSKSKIARAIARILLVTGCLICLFTLTLSTVVFLQVNNHWLRIYSDNGHYALIIQLIILIIAAGVIATGDAKEKDWMERNV